MFWKLLAVGFGIAMLYLLWLPDVSLLRHQNPKSTSLMELRVKQAKAAGKKLKVRMVWRNLDDLSPHLIHAVFLAEDDTFYQHHGFDFEQIREAFRRNWKEKKYVYGGSTITQQLARTLYLSPKKNILRKLKEAVITIYLERSLSKRRILEIYLNVIEWGPGIFGAQAAAQHYFGISAAELNPDEAVALVSILPSPRRWSPVSEKAFMARRRTNLLGRMQEAGYLPVAVSTEAETTAEWADGPAETPPDWPAPLNGDALFGDTHEPAQTPPRRASLSSPK